MFSDLELKKCDCENSNCHEQVTITPETLAEIRRLGQVVISVNCRSSPKRTDVLVRRESGYSVYLATADCLVF